MITNVKLNQLKQKALDVRINLGFGDVETAIASDEIVVKRSDLVELIEELEIYRRKNNP